MGKINREDMLELTRRMTVKRSCFSRMAGAYLDEEGYVDGTFNIHFLKLTEAEREFNLKLAKAIPFAETNVELEEFRFSPDDEKTGSLWQMLMGLLNCELKNDALLDLLYEVLGDSWPVNEPMAVYFFFGNYDIPRKGTDKEFQGESEDVYMFVICAVCPIHGDYEADPPVSGFLFPAYKDRCGDLDHVQIFQKEWGNRFLPHMLFPSQSEGNR